MELLAGGGVLTIPNQDFLHLELFAGIGKKFPLFGETVQVALYYIAADSSQTALEGNWKIGFNFYNAFLKEWAY